MDFSCYRKKYFGSNFWKMTKLFISCCYRDLLFNTNALFTYILYFVCLSCVGFGILKALKPRTNQLAPRNIDLFYTSVSAATVSSMSAVEMEVFSNSQLMSMTFLMFAGGEIFVSMLILRLNALKMARTSRVEGKTEPPVSDSPSTTRYQTSSGFDQIELNVVKVRDEMGSSPSHQSLNDESVLKHDSIKFLSFVALGYLLVVQVFGIASVLIYLTLVTGAENVLRNKGIKTFTFALFTVVSTFSSCGFVPTNENMIVFRKNSGLLLILIPQILLGNTLFPSALRVVLWIVGTKNMRPEPKYLLESNASHIGYMHLLSSLQSLLLAATVFGFLLIGFVLFSSMEWNTPGLEGLNTYQKVVCILFLCTNARHSGESIVDLSTIAPAILVFFVIMMYLPPYTSFLPVAKDEQIPSKCEAKEKKRNTVNQNFVFSQLSYLAIFIILICITERKSLKEDPLNFSVLNITFEVISAYGNVGFTTGYSCDRQLRADPNCVNKWYGLSGKWSDEGKIILIIVMFFGRLKQFNMKGGGAWMLS
ncbi:probable cation transporter HKT1;4 [Salvia miltiorrhiza]|uniref:probable cation transporter HKT1;4 n=1 Tax=Salvia miltiorrhiza TaxID=226208 RepID=UPI0025ACA3FE|nr:probable cation transporter HKT1;4 [Salvia miltiorrhiza]